MYVCGGFTGPLYSEDSSLNTVLSPLVREIFRVWGSLWKTASTFGVENARKYFVYILDCGFSALISYSDLIYFLSYMNF